MRAAIVMPVRLNDTIVAWLSILSIGFLISGVSDGCIHAISISWWLKKAPFSRFYPTSLPNGPANAFNRDALLLGVGFDFSLFYAYLVAPLRLMHSIATPCY